MDRTRRNCLILSLTAGCLVAGPEAHAETIAWWRFEQGFGTEAGGSGLEISPGPDVTFSDSVPGAVITTGGQTLPNKSSYLNGSKSDSRVENASPIDEVVSKSPFTIEAFIKLESPTGASDFVTNFCRIIGTATNEADGGWCWMVHQDKLRFYASSAKNGEIVTLTSQLELSRNTWHHVAVVGIRDGDFLDLQLYIDGEAQPETAQIEGLVGEAIMPLKGPCIIGGYNPFVGLIDELRISNQALSPSAFLIAKP